jgi:hypothetical protein
MDDKSTRQANQDGGDDLRPRHRRAPRKPATRTAPVKEQPEQAEANHQPALDRTINWPTTSPLHPHSRSAKRLLKKFGNKVASLNDLLAFRNANLKKSIVRLARLCEPFAWIHRLDASHSRRPPDWRWQLALSWLMSGSERIPRRIARQIEPIIRLQLGISIGTRDKQLMRILGIPAALIDAFDCRYAQGGSQSSQLVLEARVLARMSVEEISQATAWTPATIVWYGRAYFDVNDRLGCPSFITHAAIEPRLPLDREICRLSYWGGPVISEALLLGFDRTTARPSNPTEIERFLHADIASTMRHIACLAIHLLDPCDPKTAIKLLRLHFQLEHRDRATRARTRPEPDIQANIAAFRKSLAPLSDPDSALSGLQAFAATASPEKGAANDFNSPRSGGAEKKV